MEYRVCFRMELYLEANSEEEAREAFENAEIDEARFVEVLTVEEEND